MERYRIIYSKKRSSPEYIATCPEKNVSAKGKTVHEATRALHRELLERGLLEYKGR